MLTILKKSNTIASRPGQQVRPVFINVDAEPGRDRQLKPQLGNSEDIGRDQDDDNKYVLGEILEELD